MKTLLVYDTYYGMTEQIAKAMVEVLLRTSTVQLVKVDQAQTIAVQEYDLLIIGGPTRKFSPSQPILDYTATLSTEVLNSLKVALFDTRIKLDTIKGGVIRWVVNKGGFASDHLKKSLVERGVTTILATAGFTVDGMEGPLTNGELEKAAEWAELLIKESSFESAEAKD